MASLVDTATAGAKASEKPEEQFDEREFRGRSGEGSNSSPETPHSLALHFDIVVNRDSTIASDLDHEYPLSER